MNELTEHNGELFDQTESSKDMTTDISAQVQHVAAMINEMVELTAESVKHAQTSSGDLDSLVTTTGTMVKLSSEVEQVLVAFKEEFETVKNQTSTIEDINDQTNLLALNASIEACRRSRQRFCSRCRADSQTKCRDAVFFRSDPGGPHAS